MAASSSSSSSSAIAFTSLLQRRLSSTLASCKYPPSFEFHFFSHSPTLPRTPSSSHRPPAATSSLGKLSATDREPVKPRTLGAPRKSAPGSRSLGRKDERLQESESLRDLVSSLVRERVPNDANGRKGGSFREKREKREKGSAGSDSRAELSDKGASSKKPRKDGKLELPDVRVRVALDQCSKRGDFKGAIELYDSARGDGIRLEQYHYTVLLYLCSSAAVGVVKPAKSGSGSRVLNSLGLARGSPGELGNASGYSRGDRAIRLSDDLKEYALKRGFEIYDEMLSENVPMNEATLTSLARMAMAMEDGDMAFDTVKQMKSLGISPRLRSYGPALTVFCDNGNVQRAFEVENHMLENGVHPEEPELEALLKVSITAGKGEKVYYLLHKLRTSVRKVSPSTAELIEKWFQSSAASKTGKRKWEQKLIREAIRNAGGGWHGQGWLGRGKWEVSRASVGDDGWCKCCAEKLTLIDLDPKETENFAESVAAIARKRESNSSFQKFQRWLDYYGPFEAVVDGANVGLFSQQRFVPAKVNAVVNGIRQKLPSKRWPLIVLHNRRVTGPKMDEPVNRTLIEKWKNADALYATPTGSNDDWYWLYAAIKFKCLLVTNDEMRDHTFQLLGNDFFPKWKERHQVRFGFSDAGPEFTMPPPCSIVIQESEKGHWHIPIMSEDGLEADRTWLCVTRASSGVETGSQDMRLLHGRDSTAAENATQVVADLKPELVEQAKDDNSKCPPEKTYETLRSIFSASISPSSAVLSELEAAEYFCDSPIDFQI